MIDEPRPACTDHAYLFEWIIDKTVYPSAQERLGTQRKVRASVNMARKVCLGDKARGVPACPVFDACLTQHGRDYSLGVIAAMTDAERKARYEDVPA